MTDTSYETCQIPEHAEHPEQCKCYRNAPGFFAEESNKRIYHTVTLTKLNVRALQEKVVMGQLEKILDAVYSKSATNAGWTVYSAPEAWTVEEGEQENTNRLNLFVTFDHPTREHDEIELQGILRKISSKAAQPVFGRWTLTEVDGERYEPVSYNETGEAEEPEFGYAPVSIPDDFESYFSHLYGLDHQIGMVKAALEAGIMTNWSRRENCVLYGPPGCGKSDVVLSLKRALGEEAVWSLDGTAMTSAGVIKELTERETLPRIIAIEEIEKAQNEEAVNMLLSIMDQRGEVRKTTARDNVQRDTKCFVIVTVNDYDKYERMRAGALESRTPQDIMFNRPSREVLKQILSREVERMGGDLNWVEPALLFCDKWGISDPRKVTSVLVCGREKLLTGEYQEMKEATMNPTRYNTEGE